MAALAMVAVLVGCGDLDEIEVDGKTRRVLVREPAGADEALRPAVIVFHGAYGNPRQMERYTEMTAAAGARGVVVAYPRGWLGLWNDGRIADTVDDVAFTDALIDHLLDAYDVDPERVYVTGISNGAFMAHRVGCELADRVAAVAPVAGSLSEELVASCEPARPMPVWMVMGTSDRFVPYDGGKLGGRWTGGRFGTMLSAEETAAHWAGLNGCEAVPALDGSNTVEDDTRVERARYTRCEAGAAVEWWTVRGGGHTWPGARHVTGFGAVTREISADDEMLAFFARHSRGAP